MPDVSTRLDENTQPEPTTGCMLWIRSTDTNGYGMLCVDGRKRKAHRVAWELANGPIPAGLHVLHRCDTPACVNPAHLFLGTHTDNMRDCSAKGRTRGTAATYGTLTHCRQGHRFTAENTYNRVRGGSPRRQCRTCMREANRKNRRRNGQSQD